LIEKPESEISEVTEPSARVDDDEVESHSTPSESAGRPTRPRSVAPVDIAGSFVHADIDASSDHNGSARDLEAEGDIAADYIEELLDIVDLDGDIEIDARSGRAYLSVTSNEDQSLRLLSDPETVTALQELTRIAVQTKTGGFSRLILDVGGSRKAREAELAVLVDTAVSRLEGGAASAAMPPMSSYERKLVHDLVAERGFSSESVGEGRDRHTVVRAA